MNRFARWTNSNVRMRALLAALVLIPVGVARADNPLEDLEDAIVFNARIFHYDPAFEKALNAAADAERQKLKPGENRTFGVYVEYASGQEDWPVFKFLHPKDQDLISAPNVRRRADIVIRKERLAQATPALPPSREAFNAVMNKFPDAKPRPTYEDLAFAFEAGNHLSGLSASFDFEAAEKGKAQLPAASKLVDLLDTRLYAPGDATVILVAEADSPDYAVFDPDTKKTQVTKKQEGLKTGGNTVYLLVPWRGAEYTVACRRLRSMNVKPGDRVKAAQVIGEFPPPTDARPTPPPGVEIWRVPKPGNRWLADRSSKDGAYLVYGKER